MSGVQLLQSHWAAASTTIPTAAQVEPIPSSPQPTATTYSTPIHHWLDSEANVHPVTCSSQAHMDTTEVTYSLSMLSSLYIHTVYLPNTARPFTQLSWLECLLSAVTAHPNLQFLFAGWHGNLICDLCFHYRDLCVRVYVCTCMHGTGTRRDTDMV